MTIRLKNLGMLCLAALLVYGCTDDSTSNSDNGAEATGARSGADPSDATKLRQFQAIVSALEADTEVILGIDAGDNMTPALTPLQNEAFARFGAMWEQARGYTPNVAADAAIVHQARLKANIELEEISNWIERQDDPRNAFFISRTLIMLLKAYAEANDMVFPYRIRPDGSVPNIEAREDGLSVLRQSAGPCVVIIAPEVAAGTAATVGAIAKGVAVAGSAVVAAYAAVTTRVETWECVDYDVKLFDRLCCGLVCSYSRGFISEDTDCIVGSVRVSDDYENLDQDDCAEIIHPDMGPPDMGPPEMGPPDMGPPDMDVPDMKTPDVGVEEQDAGEVPGNEQPSERQ